MFQQYVNAQSYIDEVVYLPFVRRYYPRGGCLLQLDNTPAHRARRNRTVSFAWIGLLSPRHGSN